MTRSRNWLPVALTLALLVVGCGQKAANQPADVASDSSSGTTLDTSLFQTPTTATPTPAPNVLPTFPPATTSATATIAPTAAPTVAPTAAPTVAPTVAPTAAPTAAPTVAPTPPIDLAYALRASVTNKSMTSHLIFWTKLASVSVDVQNPSFLLRQSGKLVVTFSKAGVVTETQELPVILNPAEIRSYVLAPTKTSDDARADVINL